MDNEKKTFKKILNIVFNVLVYAFMVLGVFIVTFTIFSKRDADGAVNIFGMQMRIVISPSMEKCEETDVSGYKIKDIPVKSMIFVELVPENEEEAEKWYSELEVGDVLTFRYKYETQETITHRIVSIKEKPKGGYIITLEGDNKASDANTLKQTIDTSLAETSPNYIIGKVTGQSVVLGFLVYSIKQPLSMVLLVIVPCAVIIILEVLKIINVLTADKKKRFAEEKEKIERDKEKQTNEIEELRRQIAELQNLKTAPIEPQKSDEGNAEE